MPPNPYSGLIWVDEIFGLEPRWTYEPEISAIEKTVQSLYHTNATQVKYLTEGAFNKIYQVHIDDETLIMRVSLPVYPVRKTRSEVATVDWVRRVTDIPLPKIVAYDATRANEVGFEWILMTEITGRPLADFWQALSIPVKTSLVKTFAKFSASLWRNQLNGIGNIYSPHGNHTKAGPKTGQIVSLEFFWGSRARQNVCRGPFLSSPDWIEARLALAKNSCQEIQTNYSARDGPDSDAEDELEATAETLELIEKLEIISPRVFPRNTQIPEPTVIFHDDLSQHNILVNDKGDLLGVLDWECVSALPLWKACYYPTFLRGQPRHIKPKIEWYDGGKPGPNSAYWDHLQEHEATFLRSVFMGEMKRLEPGWVGVFNVSHLQRDFDTALQYFDCGIVRHKILEWVQDVIDGNEYHPSLRDKLGC